MDENKDSKYSIKELRENTKSYAESGELIQSISIFFSENQSNIYTIDEIFEVAISPFHSINLNDFAILLVVKVICNFWVDEGKLQVVEINGEYFYHA